MEVLLIEAPEPPLNRRRGDGSRAVEYLQAKDPEIEMQEKRELLKEHAGVDE